MQALLKQNTKNFRNEVILQEIPSITSTHTEALQIDHHKMEHFINSVEKLTEKTVDGMEQRVNGDVS